MLAYPSRPPLSGHMGAAASTHFSATAAAMSVLERGGNAFDAAVAAGFVLHLVEPHLNGPGGDLVGLVLQPGWAQPRVLAGQGPAPAAATIAYVRDELGLGLMPGSGLLPAAIPGAVDAWLLLLRDMGTWDLASVLDYALGYATRGVMVDAPTARAIASVQQLFVEHWHTSAAQWLSGGAAPRPGTLIRHPSWARTLRMLIAASKAGPTREAGIDKARLVWREGPVAQAFAAGVATAVMDGSGRPHRGLLSAPDMAGWQAGWEQASHIRFRGCDIFKAGAWSQAPAGLEALALLSACDDDELDPGSGPGAHRVLQALSLALADREAYLGDTPGNTAALVDELTAPSYLAQRRGLMGPRALDGLEAGRLPGRSPWMPRHLRSGCRAASGSDASAGEPSQLALESRPGEGEAGPLGTVRGDTCHVDVTDRWGNMIAVTPSGGWLQSSPLIPEVGCALGTRLQMTWLDETSPSALRPGRRPRTTLSPTMVMRGGHGYLACGTPGGDQQDQWQVMFLLRHLVGAAPLQEAIDAPMLHSLAAPASFWPRERVPAGVVAEGQVDAGVVEYLRACGYAVEVTRPWSLGRLCAVERDGGLLLAAASSRAMAYAAAR